MAASQSKGQSLCEPCFHVRPTINRLESLLHLEMRYKLGGRDTRRRAISKRGSPGRVKPRTIFNFSTGVTVFKSERIVCAARLDVLNIAERPFAYNFGNPSEGMHFGHGRRWSGGLKIEFR